MTRTHRSFAALLLAVVLGVVSAGAVSGEPAASAAPSLAAPSLAAPSLAASSPAVRLVSDEWPPFTDVEGKPREALDLVESALLRSGVRSAFSIMSWSKALGLLEKGQLDGSAAIWKNAEREKYLLFSRPYLENRLVLVARKGTNVSQSSLSELAGERLALTKGYAYGAELTQEANLRRTFFDSDAECLRAVLKGQADYLLLDELMVQHLFRAYPDRAQRLIVSGSVALETHPLHLALRRDYPGAAQLIADFERNIEGMMKDGTYNVLLHTPWIRKDVNGDGSLDYVASSKVAVGPGKDPALTHSGYPVFDPSKRFAGMETRAPAYLIDGKSYNNWGDAATTLDHAGTKPAEGVYKYATGFVLGSF
jgi:polar amino acid transport system substrate-binding protein